MTEMYKIYVGNLAWEVCDADLDDGFREFGDIVDVAVITDRNTQRSRGFGFVTFGSQESVEKAIKAMNEEDFMGRQITVREAEERRDDGDQGQGYKHVDKTHYGHRGGRGNTSGYFGHRGQGYQNRGHRGNYRGRNNDEYHEHNTGYRGRGNVGRYQRWGGDGGGYRGRSRGYRGGRGAYYTEDTNNEAYRGRGGSRGYYDNRGGRGGNRSGRRNYRGGFY